MKKILITGGTGMVGHAFQKIIPEAIFVSSRDFCRTSPGTSCSLGSQGGRS